MRIPDVSGFLAGLAIAFAFGPLTGCSNGPSRVPVYPTQGRIVHQGKPAVGAIVILHPDGDASISDMKARGKADDSGEFQLTTYERHDGAPAGDYLVTIYWPAPRPVGAPDLDDGPDRLKGRFLDIKSPLTRVTIPPRTNVLEEIVIP